MKSLNNKANKSKTTSAQSKPNPKTDSKESKLQKLVKANPNFQFIENGKVKCTLTGHEFAPTLDNYEQYLKSKSYKKGLESQFDISEYEDFLVPFKDNHHFLFCRLTGVKLPKKKTAIEKHVKSRRFKTRMEQIQAENEKEEESLDIVDEEEGDEEQEEEGEGEAQDSELEQEQEKVQIRGQKNGRGQK